MEKKYKLGAELTAEKQAELNADIIKYATSEIIKDKNGNDIEFKTKDYVDKFGRITHICYVGDEEGYLKGVKDADERAETDKQKELAGETIIEITEKEYNELLKRSETLYRLEVYGVDNWDGYCDAINDSEGFAAE